MNVSIFYLTAILWSLCGLWILWQFGFRPLLLANFRDALFALRNELYQLAQDGSISCEDDAYRSVEILLSGVIRFAHRFTFTFLVFSQVEYDRLVDRPKNQKDQEVTSKLFAKVDALPDERVRDQLNSIVTNTTILLQGYAAKSSLIFLLLTSVYFVVRYFRPVLAKQGKNAAIAVFQREAYHSAEFEPYAPVGSAA